MEIRERIIAAYSELARLQGFHAVTMDELAVRARVSKRTIYRYFRSKVEIIEATLDAFMAEIATEALAWPVLKHRPRKYLHRHLRLPVPPRPVHHQHQGAARFATALSPVMGKDRQVQGRPHCGHHRGIDKN